MEKNKLLKVERRTYIEEPLNEAVIDTDKFKSTMGGQTFTRFLADAC